MKKLTTIGSIATLGMLLIALNLGGSAGCGSSGGGDVDAGTGTGDPTADTVTTTSDALTVASEATSSALSSGAGLSALVANGLKASTSTTVDSSVACTTGSVAVTGSVETTDNSGSIDLDLAFEDCEGINGDLGVSADMTLTETTFDFSMSFDGTLGGNGCELSFDDLTASVSAEVSGEEVSTSGTLDGGISATCGNDSVSCTWDNVSLDDESGLEGDCTCTGDGCSS